MAGPNQTTPLGYQGYTPEQIKSLRDYSTALQSGKGRAGFDPAHPLSYSWANGLDNMVAQLMSGHLAKQADISERAQVGNQGALETPGPNAPVTPLDAAGRPQASSGQSDVLNPQNRADVDAMYPKTADADTPATPGSPSALVTPAHKAAIAKIETGGSKNPYQNVGVPTKKMGRALGKYQVMEANLEPWTKAAFGKPMSRQDFLNNPGAQEGLFEHRFGGYLQKYGNADDAASAWFTGGPRSARTAKMHDPLGTSGASYVQQFASALKGQPPGPATASAAPTGQVASDAPTPGMSTAPMAYAGDPAKQPGSGGLPSALTSPDSMPNQNIGAVPPMGPGNSPARGATAPAPVPPAALGPQVQTAAALKGQPPPGMPGAPGAAIGGQPGRYINPPVPMLTPQKMQAIMAGPMDPTMKQQLMQQYQAQFQPQVIPHPSGHGTVSYDPRTGEQRWNPGAEKYEVTGEGGVKTEKVRIWDTPDSFHIQGPSNTNAPYDPNVGQQNNPTMAPAGGGGTPAPAPAAPAPSGGTPAPSGAGAPAPAGKTGGADPTSIGLPATTPFKYVADALAEKPGAKEPQPPNPDVEPFIENQQKYANAKKSWETKQAGDQKNGEAWLKDAATMSNRASASIPQIDEMLKIIQDPDTPRGATGPAFAHFYNATSSLYKNLPTSVASAASKMTGVTPDQINKMEDMAAKSDALTKLSSGLVVESLRPFLGNNAGQFRVAEIVLIEKALANPHLSQPGNVAVANLTKGIAQRALDEDQMAQAYASRNNGVLDDRFWRQLEKFDRENPILQGDARKAYDDAVGRKAEPGPMGTPAPSGRIKYDAQGNRVK